MGAQIRGLNRSIQNLTDSIGLIQTTEGALQEVSALLQRGRELAVQAANDTLSGDDRKNVQQEVLEIISEVERIATTSEYNTKKVFDTSAVTNDNALERAILDNLKRGWLGNSEELVKNLYGIEADDQNLEVVFVNAGVGGYIASVSGTVGGGGKTDNMKLNINLDHFTSTSWPDGPVSGGFYQDRTIAHEMVHAVMGRSMNMAALPTWFKEGTAEFLGGADDRLLADGGDTSAAARTAIVDSVTDGSWSSTSQEYSGSFAAVRYLHQAIKAAGGTGLKDLMTGLSGGMTLDAAIAANTAFAGTAAFLTDFDTNGEAFIDAMDLTNADLGGIGGLDADGGAARTAESTIPDTDNYSNDPLDRFVEVFPNYGIGFASRANPLKFQLGTGAGETMDVSMVNVTAAALDIAGLDVSTSASTAITKFDEAIEQVARERGRLGAVQNRLQHALSVNQINSESTTASQSRIQDADFAVEVANLTRSQILNQASSALMAQTGNLAQGHYQVLLRLIA